MLALDQADPLPPVPCPGHMLFRVGIVLLSQQEKEGVNGIWDAAGLLTGSRPAPTPERPLPPRP